MLIPTKVNYKMINYTSRYQDIPMEIADFDDFQQKITVETDQRI